MGSAIVNGAVRMRPGGARTVVALRAFCTVALLAVTNAVAQPATATGNAVPAATAFVQRLGNDVIRQLSAPAIPLPEREARFYRLLSHRFDLATISKFVLGRYWRSSSEAQRAEFQQLFVDYVVRIYTRLFSEYSGEVFTATGSRAVGRDTILVHSRIDMFTSEDIRVDWRLRHAGDSFAVTDIVVEGASMGMTQRSEFASVIESRGGVNGLIEALRAKSSLSASIGTQQ